MWISRQLRLLFSRLTMLNNYFASHHQFDYLPAAERTARGSNPLAQLTSKGSPRHRNPNPLGNVSAGFVVPYRQFMSVWERNGSSWPPVRSSGSTIRRVSGLSPTNRGATYSCTIR